MKKFLLMFAAVAAIAFVGCKPEAKPAEEQAPETEQAVDQPTIESVTADLMKFVEAKDETGAANFLDGLKKKAEDLLNAKDENGYFNIINIIQKVWEANKDKITELLPNLAAKMTDYITVPDAMKDGFAAFVENAAKQAGEAVQDAAADVKDAAADVKDAAAAKVEEGKEAVKDAVKEGVNNAADAAKEAVN
jgi:flagellar basal body-associated protein FliL